MGHNTDDYEEIEEKPKNRGFEIDAERIRARTQIRVALIALIGVIITALAALFPTHSPNGSYQPVIVALAYAISGNSPIQNITLTPNGVGTAVVMTLTAIAPTINTQASPTNILLTTPPTILATTSVDQVTPTLTKILITPTLPPSSAIWTVDVGGNGHLYQLVEVEGGQITWTGAKDRAAKTNFSGIPGHLATITSGEENLFIMRTWEDRIIDKWLGGYQIPNSQEPSGGWTWITGESWNYSNWASNEPNQADGEEENALHYKWLGTGARLGQWNDLSESSYEYGNHQMNGYIVEFDINS